MVGFDIQEVVCDSAVFVGWEFNFGRLRREGCGVQHWVSPLSRNLEEQVGEKLKYGLRIEQGPREVLSDRERPGHIRKQERAGETSTEDVRRRGGTSWESIRKEGSARQGHHWKEGEETGMKKERNEHKKHFEVQRSQGVRLSSKWEKGNLIEVLRKAKELGTNHWETSPSWSPVDSSVTLLPALSFPEPSPPFRPHLALPRQLQWLPNSSLHLPPRWLRCTLHPVLTSSSWEESWAGNSSVYQIKLTPF